MRQWSQIGIFLLSGLFLAAAISASSAGQFEDGLSAAKRGDYTTALVLWRPLAEGGDAVAQFNIGISYLNGYGVPKDVIQAERWLRRSAEAGYASAQNTLGNLLSLNNPELDTARASEAANWYSRAAEQGVARAQVSLGLLYEGGKGVPKDVVQALKWYIIASTDAADEKGRDFAVQNYTALAREMGAQQIANAKQLAKDWRPRASYPAR